jgi:hypothetical protein
MRQVESPSLHSIHEHESSHEHESPARDESPAGNEEPKALRFFRADTFWEAARSARDVLRGAQNCPRCSRALAHLYDRLGSTLFHDDDPQALIRAFDPEDQSSCTLKIVAACIVLDGRERVEPTVH